MDGGAPLDRTDYLEEKGKEATGIFFSWVFISAVSPPRRFIVYKV